MSNWDDEDFDVPVASTTNRFDDEDDDAVLDDWEAAGESEEEEKPVGPTRVRVGAEQRKADRERKEQEERERKALEQGEEDAKTKKERLQQAQVESDLNNAAALFGEVNLHPKERAARETSVGSDSSRGPTKLSDLAIFKPKTKADFENLRKTLAPLLQELHEVSNLHYSNFATDLARDICKPMSLDQIRKASATLNALSNEKQREERMNRGKKKKPIVKAASQKVDEEKDVTNYDDFGDDDFM